MATVHEQLSEQFYRWEQRGRGWQIHGSPVYLEPPFVAFDGHYQPKDPVPDDGRRPTVLSSFFRRLNPLPGVPPVIPEPEAEPEPKPLVREDLVELQASLPSDLVISKDAFAQFLSSLGLCREPLSFELLGTHNKVTAQFAVHSDDAPLLRRQLKAFFPDAVFQPQMGSLREAWDASDGGLELAADFGLEREFMFPLASGKLDPFIGIIGALSELEPAELGLFQVLFQPVQNNWTESITRAVTNDEGKAFFVNMPELTKAAKDKVSHPLYAVVVRILVKTAELERTLRISQDLAGSLRVFINPQGNALVPLDSEGYQVEDHVDDIICRQSRRSGMLLNADELIGFVHLPSSDVRSPVLQRQIGKTKSAPLKAQNKNGLLLGHNLHMGKTVEVRLTPNQRVRHTHIIGASGKGKSTLLFNLIRQDIENGEGVGVLDPHGDLVKKILGIIPPHRIDDVVLVDPSDPQYSVGFNILTAHSDTEKTLLASDLVSVFRRLSTSWGDQMGSVLNNAILVFLESKRGGTIADLRRFLIEPAYRAEVLKTIHDSELIYYWQKGFPLLSGNKSIGPILTRLETFLAPKPVRYMVSQSANRLDFADIMDSGKIFLATLPEGTVGKENSFLLGSLLVAKFQQLAMARQEQEESARRDFWLYIDEFQNFITPSMAEILRATRKFRLGLTLAHQELRQLEKEPDVASAIMANPETRIFFGVSDNDARKLAPSLTFFDSQDLQNLEPGQAICRIEKASQDFNLTVPFSEDIPFEQAKATRASVTAASRQKYSRLRTEIEADLLISLGVARPPVETKPAPVAPPTVTPTPLSVPPALHVSASEPNLSEPKLAEVPKPPPAVEPKTPEPDELDSTSGQHIAIKEKIGSEAEALDYSVTYEQHFPPIQARADIVLRRGKHHIVVQVTVTTPAEYEADSVRKFLKASFTHTAVISVNRQKLNLIRKTLGATGEKAEMVGFYSPEEFMSKLSDWALDDPAGGIAEKKNPHKNPKLNLNSGPLTEAEQKQNEKILLESLKQKLKRNNNPS